VHNVSHPYCAPIVQSPQLYIKKLVLKDVTIVDIRQKPEKAAPIVEKAIFFIEVLELKMSKKN
jgi:hypothetical protein